MNHAQKLSTALPSPLPRFRLRDALYMVAFSALLWWHLDKGSEIDHKVIEARSEEIRSCQKVMDSAQNHARVLAALLNEGHHVLTAPGAKAYCKTYRVKS